MKTAAVKNKKATKVLGPSLFEVEYLRQLKEELQVFLQSRNFSTIQELQIAFVGPDYAGRLQIRA